MFSKNLGAVVIGRMSDKQKGKLRHFLRAKDPWYYMYVERIANEGIEVTETLQLEDYLFRHDRGAFWGGRFAFEYFGIPFNRLTRFVLNPILHTRKLYQALQEGSATQMFICQDLVLPTKSVLDFLEFVENKIGIYPVGVWPMKPEPRSPLQCNGIKTDLVYNIGVYGLKVEAYDKFVALNKAIEAKTSELGGKKWFYAHSYYSESEFWQIYDKKWYEGLRSKYHATYLPNIFEKIRVKERHDINTKRALYKTILGRAKLHVVD